VEVLISTPIGSHWSLTCFTHQLRYELSQLQRHPISRLRPARVRIARSSYGWFSARNLHSSRVHTPMTRVPICPNERESVHTTERNLCCQVVLDVKWSEVRTTNKTDEQGRRGLNGGTDEPHFYRGGKSLSHLIVLWTWSRIQNVASYAKVLRALCSPLKPPVSRYLSQTFPFFWKLININSFIFFWV
jgi:hypothetical protein